MQDQCDTITRQVTVAAGRFAPGHLGELTQVVDFDLVDAVVAETGTAQKRMRLLPTRVVIYFVLGLALFDKCAYRQVWGKLTAALGSLVAVRPCAAALTRARRRVGPAPLRALFTAISGPVATPQVTQAFWRGLRTVAIDGTSLHVPDSDSVAARYPKRRGKGPFDYPLLRLVVLIECGTRALLGAAFGPESQGELDYGQQLLAVLGEGMLLLADAGYDSWTWLRDVAATKAHYLVRSTATRTPLVLTELGDGSYLSVIGPRRLKVRIIEAWITVTYADGTIRREQWRLLTSLLDARRWPAGELVELYHQRWQVETAYFAIKSTILDGRVLRSRHPRDIDQEVWALLTLYQAIVHLCSDTLCHEPHLDPHRISFTVALESARDQATNAAGIVPTVLVGAIGQAVLASLHPPQRRSRIKARWRKNSHSKYHSNYGKWPQKAQTYALSLEVTIMEEGLTARSRS